MPIDPFNVITRSASPQYLHTALWGAAAGLACYRFKPRVRFPTTIIGVAAVSGYGVGILDYFRQHKKFARKLDDREAFLLVLENVNKRLGSQTPLFPQLDNNKILESIMKRREEHGEVLNPGADLLGNPSTITSDAAAPTPSSGPAALPQGDAALRRRRFIDA